jgi:hypothetical protein
MTDAMRKKLNGKGVRSVKDLATVNIQKLKMEGAALEKVRKLKKEAQKALYVQASSRVVTMARDVEQQVRTGLKAVLEAAWEAEHRAIEALRASQSKAYELADLAADRARHAAGVAEVTARQLLEEIARAPQKAREAWERYGDAATEAQAKAASAATKAAAAAGRRVQEGAEVVVEQSRSLFTRLRQKMGGPGRKSS